MEEPGHGRERAALRLRRMTADDVFAVGEIERDAFAHGWPATAFERELTKNAVARYIVLECGQGAASELLGFAGLWLQLDEAHVVTVAVPPTHRRRGYARLLLHALLDLAREEGMREATLEVRESNAAARALYRTYGFYEVGERKRYYSDNGEDAIIMTTEEFDSDGFQRRWAKLSEVLDERFPGVARSVPAEPLA